jgi:hypothetical protein
MSTQKKKYRKNKISSEDNINYSEEEIESLCLEVDDSDSFDKEDEFLEETDEDFEEEEIDIKVKPEVKVKDEKPKRGKKPDPNKIAYYVDPKEFDQEIQNYYKSGILSNELAEMVSKIAHKLSFASNFINYSYREEMVGDGIIRMFKALMSKKYSHDKGTNPFSYFTRIAFNAFRNRIKKEKHIHETHEKYQAEFMMFSENYNNMMKNNRTKGYKKNE